MGNLRGVDFKGKVWEFATCQAVVSGSEQTLAETRVFLSQMSQILGAVVFL